MAKEVEANLRNEAISEMKAIIKERRPRTEYGSSMFKLIEGTTKMLSPKFLFRAKNGYKLEIRYVKSSNSLLVEDQEDNGDVIRLEHIGLKASTTINDKLLVDYLLINPRFNKWYTLYDPNGEAEREIERINEFDDVYYQVRNLKEEEIKSLILLTTDYTLHEVEKMKPASMLLQMRVKCEKNPKEIKEAMNSPLMKTLYLANMSEALDLIKYDNKTGMILWSDSRKELCRVPENKDPMMHLARLLLEEQYIKARDLLETKING